MLEKIELAIAYGAKVFGDLFVAPFFKIDDKAKNDQKALTDRSIKKKEWNIRGSVGAMVIFGTLFSLGLFAHAFITHFC